MARYSKREQVAWTARSNPEPNELMRSIEAYYIDQYLANYHYLANFLVNPLPVVLSLPNLVCCILYTIYVSWAPFLARKMPKWMSFGEDENERMSRLPCVGNSETEHFDSSSLDKWDDVCKARPCLIVALTSLTSSSILLPQFLISILHIYNLVSYA
jgi:hypothetical protein